MPSKCQDFHEKSFRIMHDDDKFFTRLLTKETSKSSPSSRVYYNDVPSAVPFVWETTPGTPKHNLSCDDLNIPPLTPPPSYYSSNPNASSKKQSRSKLIFHALLRRMNPRKVHVASSSPSSSSSSSSSSYSSLSWSSSLHSSHSDPTMTPKTTYKRRRSSSWGSSFDERATDSASEVCPSSTRFCFGIGKKNLFSIVGSGSA